jgi:hypothetical protein
VVALHYLPTSPLYDLTPYTHLRIFFFIFYILLHIFIFIFVFEKGEEKERRGREEDRRIDEFDNFQIWQSARAKSHPIWECDSMAQAMCGSCFLLGEQTQ